MYELVRLTEDCYYIDCPSRIGVIKVGDGQVCLIDSGNNADTGKRVLKALSAEGLNPVAIYNTHSHADHVGGNRYIQDQTGCPIYAPGIECDFANHPILEAAFMYGGYPPPHLCHKFLVAKESRVLPLTDDVLPKGVEIIPLPGHSFDMVGFRTASGVIYLGDCLSSREILDKYGVGVIYNVDAYLKTLSMVETLDGKIFVPSHVSPTTEIASLARYNAEKVNKTIETVLSLCGEGSEADAIINGVFDAFSMTMTPEQNALVGNAVRSYISYLSARGDIMPIIKDNRMLWAKKSENKESEN